MKRTQAKLILRDNGVQSLIQGLKDFRNCDDPGIDDGHVVLLLNAYKRLQKDLQKIARRKP